MSEVLLESHDGVPTVTRALELFARGELLPSELLDRILSRVDEHDAELGAFVSVDRDGARRAAAAADRAWAAGQAPALCGIPVSIKDLIDVRGEVTGCGNPSLVREAAAADAPVVERLRRAGAVIVGKAHLHEIALGITGENTLMGTPRNPHDPRRIAGGSSSGSAVSVAAGMSLASVGTDTGGSIRVPSALCGLVGFKPTRGRISVEGVQPLSWTMDHVGIIGRQVDDVALIFAALREGADPIDPSPAPAAKVGVLEQLFERADPRIGAAFERGRAALRERGVTLRRVELPMLPALMEIYTTIVLSEAAAVHQEAMRQRPHVFAPSTRALLDRGGEILAVDYARALRSRDEFARSCAALLAEHDTLVAPTTLAPAPLRGAGFVQVDGRELPVRDALVCCTSPFSMIGLPALSAPLGIVEGTPVGVQLIGPRGGDLQVLSAARLVGECMPDEAHA